MLHGKIGEYGVVARRKGEDWFVGCLNAVESRTLEVSLDFLPEGAAFDAYLYVDDPGVGTRTKVGIQKRTVTSRSVIKAEMGKKGGMAMRIVPQSSDH